MGEVIVLPGAALPRPVEQVLPTPPGHWMTASEIATARLPGLPSSEFRIRERAVRERWHGRPRPGTKGGGGYEYSVNSLPEKARAALNRRMERVRLAEIAKDPSPVQREADLKSWQQEIVAARTSFIRAIERRALEMSLNKAIDSIAADSAKGLLDGYLAQKAVVANARSGKSAKEDGSASITSRTLYRWWTQWQTGGFAALAPFSPKDKRGEPAWALAFLKLWRFPTKRSIRSILEDLPAQLPAGVEMPSYDQVRRFLNSLGAVERERGRRGSQELKALKGYVRRTTDHLRPLDVIISDGHCFDADDVAHPVHGRPFRPELSVVLDVATRRAIGWSAALSESTWATIGALRMALKAGLPAMFYTDRGSGYCNEIVAEMLGRMGCTHTTALPYNSQARGMIERAHKSIWVRAAKTRVGYLGGDMDPQARRKVVKVVKADLKENGASSLLTPWPAFLAWAQQVVDAYNDRPHSSLPKITDPATGKLRHQSPNEAWEAHRLENWEPMLVSDAELDDIMRPYEARVTTRGSVSLFGNTYFSNALEPFHGRTVKVGYDIHDASAVWLRTLDDELIGRATIDAMARPYMPMTAVDKATEQRGKRRMKTVRAREAEVLAEMGEVIDFATRRAALTHDADPTELTPDQEAVADRALALIEARETPAPSITPADTPDGRPFFLETEDWARWVLANPTKATAEDNAMLAVRLKNPSFRLLLGIDDDRESEATASA